MRRQTSPPTEKLLRLQLRVEPARAEEIAAAAEAMHQSISAFVLDAAISRAQGVLDRSAVTDLDVLHFDRLLRALDAPYEPSPALKRTAAPSTIVDLLATDEGRENEFEPPRFGLAGRTPDL